MVRRNLLILCTGNSARDIMAEALFRHYARQYFNVYSAGSRPTGLVNPWAMEQIERFGLNSLSYSSKSWDQYYYHTHRSDADEHGHFHTFLRSAGMAPESLPLDYSQASEAWPQREEAIAQLVGISMDAWGRPVGLFAANRWVTGETWYLAETVIGMPPCFAVDHAWPSWPVNLWIGAMLRLFRPHIHALLYHRDAVIAAWQGAHPRQDVFEDRNQELTGYLPISVDAWMAQLAGR
jgi:hypothetical protein